jgi:hypothetical protein
MSIPAVLYDHVPVDDIQYDSSTQNVAIEAEIFVSSMIHRTSAPREDDNSDNGDKHNKQFKQSQYINIVADSHESNDGASTNIDGEMCKESEVNVVENDDGDDLQMETIIEATDSDYVLVSIPSPTMDGDHDKILPIFSRKTTKRISKKIRAFGNSFLRATTRSSEPNNNRIVNLLKNNDIIAKCFSGWTSGSRALVKPLQLYARDLLSSSIYNSYDCLSEAVIDDSGNRLLLPGPCVAFDSDNSPNGNYDGASKLKGDNYGADMQIIPAESDFIGLKRGIIATGSIPVTSSSSCSSIWTSNTVMVSAHDLLAVKYDQRMQQGDRNTPRNLSLFDTVGDDSYRYWKDNEYNMDRSTIMVTTAQSITHQWIRALWKLTQKKTYLWYYMSQSCFQQSIKSAGRAFFYSQKFLIQHRKNDNMRSHRLLFTLSNIAFPNSEDDACNIDYDSIQRIEQESSRYVILGVPQQNLSNLSIDDSQWSDKNNVNGCDEYGFVEMTTSSSKSEHDY